MDEVFQLADKSANSLKLIEHIAIRIQGETKSIMTVIEEEKYQVNKGIKLAEEAQQSLDNIVGYTNNIDQLVYSISYDTLS
ncbi:methyl-accepting chemotaxis protein [Richelia intracellularis]|nr:methyl-accepting chemotaxis protein [Richelia intracellularis]